ncbi:MAG: carbohydrate ABC transporter permease [Trebonia sp.]
MAITAEQTLPGTVSPPRKSRVARFAGYPFVVPALAVVLAVMSYPFAYSVYLSFRSTPSYTTATTFDGLANYAAVLHDQTFLRSLENTASWTLASTVIGVLLGLGAALLVQQLRLFRGPIRAALMLPYIVGYVVASYAWLWLFQGEYGLINVTLQSWHLTSHPVSFLSSLTWAFPAVILANVWKTFPFAMVMLLAGLQGVPSEPVLAARLDRASHWRIFWEVKLPYLRRVLAITTMPLAFQNFNTFTIPYIMTGGGPLNHTEIVSNYIYNSAFTNLNFGLAAAASVIVIIILMIFAVFYVRAMGRDRVGDRKMV